MLDRLVVHRALVGARRSNVGAQHHLGHRPPSRRRAKGDGRAISVERAQPARQIAQPEPRLIDDAARRAQSDPVVAHGQAEDADVERGGDRDVSALRSPRQPVTDRVLDDRLQRHARHLHAQRLRCRLPRDGEPVGEAQPLDLEVRLQRAELLCERHRLATPVHREAE